jgi:hypothetical protein
MRTSETDGPLEKRAADRRPRCHVRVLEFFRVVVERIVVDYCGFGVVESVAQPHRLVGIIFLQDFVKLFQPDPGPVLDENQPGAVVLVQIVKLWDEG